MIDTKLKIEHLSNLLDDESPQIKKIVKETILNHALDFVFHRKLIESKSRSEYRKNLIDILSTIHADLVLAAFKQLTKGNLEDLDLEKTILVLCYWNDQNIDPHVITNQLDLIAEQVGGSMPVSGHPLSFIDHINFHLYKKLAFHGNTEDYYNPDNSLLNKVLETKKGIPITLSVLYILIAKRLGLPILGVPMPAHFILKFDNGGDEVFFDPFYKGKVYSRKECTDYLKNANTFNTEEILNGCTNYQIIIRIMRNLHLVFSSYEDEPQKIVELENYIKIIEKAYVKLNN